MRDRIAARRRRSLWPALFILLAVCALLAGGAWAAYELLPNVRARVQIAWGQLYDRLVPRPAIAPTPALSAALPTIGLPTAPPPSAVPPTGGVDTGPGALPTVAPSATPLPRSVILEGVKHEYQLYNNCGPASLAMELSYWGWAGNQKVAAAALKPEQDDKNVSPREMYDYLLTIGYDAYIRVNGDEDTLKRFIAAGYPVLVEKGFTCQAGERCTGWFGHYSVFTGYDDARGVFITQDSFISPNLKLTYAEVMDNWRAFNYLYLVAFPAGPQRDAEVAQLLGEAADLTANYYAALQRSQREALTLSGQEAAFAWFNVGTNLASLQDYAGAAQAFDQARTIGLPYRMLWYQFGPYRAYYQMARYQEVIDLATFAVGSVTPGVVPGLEESYFWRGQAEEQLGQREAAIADYRTALARNPTYQPAREALAVLGLTP